MKYKILGIILVLTLIAIVFVAMIGWRSEPPKPTLTVDGKNVPVLQGSYCWKGKCVDMISPPEMIKHQNYAPVIVPAASKLNVDFKEGGAARSLGASLWNASPSGTGSDTEIKNNTLTLPREKGTYVYMIDGSWKEGSSSYVFSVEVR